MNKRIATSTQDLEHYISISCESEGVEFKEAKTQYDTNKLLRYCVAIANEGGGKLILGITDKPPRCIIGTQAFASISKTQTHIFEKLHFRVDIEELNHPNGRVLIFHIPSRPKGTAYQLNGSYLMRSKEDTVPMSEDRLRQIFNEGKENWFLQIAKKNCSAIDVSNLLDTQAYFDMMHLPYPSDFSSVLARFEKESIVIKHKENFDITNLGAILFAKKLEDFEEAGRKRVRAIIYEDMSKLQTKLDILGVKGYAAGFQGLVEFVQTQTTINEVIEKAIRKPIKMYPEIAIRGLLPMRLFIKIFLKPECL